MNFRRFFSSSVSPALLRWAGLAVALAWGGEVFRLFEFLELRTYDARVRHRARRSAPLAKELLLVTIDPQSEELLGPFPWPHQVYEAFRSQMDVLGVRGAFFTLYFHREEPVERGGPSRSRLYLIRPYTATEMYSLWKPPRVTGWQTLPPELSSTNVVVSFSTVVSNREDGIYRALQGRVLDATTNESFLSLEALFAADILGVDASAIRLPLDAEGRWFLSRGSVPLPSVSFVDVLSAEPDSEVGRLLKDRWLIVGMSGIPNVGAVPTPFGHRTALELRAAAVNALLTGETIRPRRLLFSGVLIGGLAAIFGVLGIFWGRRGISVRSVLGVGIGGAIVYGIVAESVFVIEGTWLPMASPFVFLGTTTLTWAFAVNAERLRVAQRRALQSEREAAFGIMAAQVRHEVRNLLHSIRSPAEMLRRNFQKGDPLNLCNRPEALIAEMDVIIERTEKLSALVENELSFFQPGSLNPTVQDVWDVVESAVSLLADEMAQAKILLRREVPPLRLQARVDAERLRLVFVNLLRNAVQAMPQGGILTIAYAERVVKKRGKCLVLSVQDTGVGMEPEQLDHLFEPFYTTKARGLGLGLLNARSIVEAHQGEIRVHSVKNKGTTFEVFLPAV